MKTQDTTLAKALDILAREIHSEDGVANACIAEGAQRIRELSLERNHLRAELAVIVRCGDHNSHEIALAALEKRP